MNNTELDIKQKVIRSLVAALTVSFVALSLGAAFGVLSGRGAFAGMISAAIIATITSALGGTRIQCSGPTGPMTTVMVALFAAATGRIATQYPGLNTDHFINLTLMLMAGMLIVASILRLGRFIYLIPNVVISGFMNGIAVIIWLDQVKRLFGIAGKNALTGPLYMNALVLVVTALLVFAIPMLTKRWLPKFASLLSGTFLAIVIMTTACSVFQIEIERVSLATALRSWSDFVGLVQSQFPTDWSWPIILAALPFALQLTVLGYLDTLMTALVIDKLTGEKTKADKELFGQGAAHAVTALVGGIPGAQATIRSVLMVKEGAAWRWAGVLVGVLAMAEMLIFQDLIKLIPQAVFAGVLIKVGYDVFDWTPFVCLFKQLVRRSDPNKAFHVYPLEIVLIVGTTLVTIFLDLNIAVGVFTSFFYLYNKVISPQSPIPDLKPDSETELFSEED